MNEIVSKRKAYLSDQVGYDRILDEYHNREFSEFITTMGGDATTYRVYGSKDDLRIYCK